MAEKFKLKHKVLIVDDHPIVRQGLAQFINQETDLTVCGDASDIPSALQAVKDCQPDITVVDVSLGQSSGVRLIEDLCRLHPDLLILALSMHDESMYAERCLRAGARGYIMKKEPPEKVIVALKKILGGEIYVSDNLGATLLQKFVTKKDGVCSSPIEQLSNRELEVFQLIGHGLKTSKIAEQLNLSIKTIETYVDHIKKKMNFKDSRALFLHAVQWLMSQDKPDK
ncbi:MAG: response regulator transcription factor [Nitrospirae bacterium]|nr:response regulator transcription factor [Nitrospirota bacterium]